MKRALNTPQVEVYASLFALFLIFGSLIGFSAGQSTLFSSSKLSEQVIIPISTPATSQRSLLFIGVDRLDSPEPRLESLWLVVYFPNHPQIILLPIYPEIPDTQWAGDISPAGLTFLDSTGSLNKRFQNYLRQQRLWWNGYIMIDEIGMISVLDMLEEISPGGQISDGALALGSIPRPWDDKPVAFKGQLALLKNVCHQAGNLPSEHRLDQLLKQIDSHYRTDQDLHQILQEWAAALKEGMKPSCEFPLLESTPP